MPIAESSHWSANCPMPFIVVVIVVVGVRVVHSFGQPEAR